MLREFVDMPYSRFLDCVVLICIFELNTSFDMLLLKMRKRARERERERETVDC